MKKLLLLALIASCEGRCRATEALVDEVPGGMCTRSVDDNTGLCLRGNELYSCSITGLLFREATCVRAGTVTP